MSLEDGVTVRSQSDPVEYVELNVRWEWFMLQYSDMTRENHSISSDRSARVAEAAGSS